MKDKGLEQGDISGFLDDGTDFEGTLHFRDTLRIDGKFRGKISSTNVLIIGETAEIDGEVTVSNVSVSGRVTGKIIADSKVEIHAKGRVFCDIVTPKLVIEEGAFFHGNCDMDGSKEKLRKKAEIPPTIITPPKVGESKGPVIVAQAMKPGVAEKKDEEPAVVAQKEKK